MNRRAVTWVLVAGLALAAATGCDRGGRDDRGQASGSVPPERLADLEAFARIKLPPSAADVQLDEGVGADRTMLARFTIEAGELDRFVADAAMTRPPEPGLQPLQVGAGRHLGWRVDEIHAFRGYQDSRPGFVRHFLLDTGDQQRLVVYVVASTT